MEWSITNVAALRQQIVSSSPALRVLESQLQACALKRDNRATIAEREAQRVIMKANDKEYAEVLKKVDSQELLASSLRTAKQRTKRLENQRVLEDQMAERATAKARAEAEKTVEMMSEVDENKQMKKEKEEQARQKQDCQHTTRRILAQQSQLRHLRQEEQQLMDQQIARWGEELQVRDELEKKVKRLGEEAVRLQFNKRELALVSQLESQQMGKDAVREARLEIACLEKQEEERRHTEERQQRGLDVRASLKEGLNQQLKYKQELRTQEQDKEKEYRKLVLEVLEEEGRLDCLGREARRRRLQDHQELVERLLEDRRVRRAAAVAQHQQEAQAAMQYHKLRSSIEEEEARQMLLRHAPHLLHYLTPQLLARLHQLT